MPVSLDASNYLVCAGLALPHFLYAFIWFFPKRWMAMFKKRSVEAFETAAWALKGAITKPLPLLCCLLLQPLLDPCNCDAAGVQFLSVAFWWLLRKPSGVDVTAVPPLAWLVGLPLFGFGQVGSWDGRPTLLSASC
jgi:hypothetical protein